MMISSCILVAFGLLRMYPNIPDEAGDEECLGHLAYVLEGTKSVCSMCRPTEDQGDPMMERRGR